tara:strand:- start:532 stop:3723 length:3192 start_codon:yes stop_codon:yes gene_type:complete
MPDLNIKGNIIDNFGKHLPTPIIDFVTIRNDKLEAQVSLFFDFEDVSITDTEMDDIINYFQGDNQLYIYVAYVLGEPYADSIINKENIDIFSELYSTGGFANHRSGPLPSTGQLLSNYSNYKILPFKVASSDGSHFERSGQNFYDNDERKVIQLAATLELPVEFDGGYDFDIQSIYQNMFLAPESGLLDYFEGGLTLFAFSSWVDLSSMQTENFTASDMFALKPLEVSDGYRAFTSQYIDLMPNLAKQQFSDISYEKVFSNGYAYIEPQVFFVDQQEVVYNKTPILALNEKYYKQDGFTLDEINEAFQELVDDTKQLGEEDSQIQNILDDISTMLQTHGESSDLLIRLNLIRVTFPEKSTATEVGRFYDRYETRFLSINEAVASGTTVTEKVMRTSKVRDLRRALDTNWTPRSPEDINVIWAGSQQNLYPGGLVSAMRIYASHESAGNQGQAIEPSDDSILVKNGYWFFDYEQAVRNYSHISLVFDPEAVINYFGVELLNASFRLESASMIKHKWSGPVQGQSLVSAINEGLNTTSTLPDSPHSSQTDIAIFTTEISYDDALTPWPWGAAEEPAPWPHSTNFTLEDLNPGPTSEVEPYVSWPGADGEVGYLSYLALRGAEPVNDSQIEDNYKVMTFEFQDVEQNWDEDDINQYYSFEVKCNDYTKWIAEAIIDAYKALITDSSTGAPGSLQEYYDYASEPCNYNNIDKTFNEFFTTGIMSRYNNLEPQFYPWFFAPVMYNFHRDMLTKAFDGDMQKIIDASRAIAARINPTNGNWEDLHAFVENYKTIIDEQYTEVDSVENVWYHLKNSMNQEDAVFGSPNKTTKSRGPGPVQHYPMPNPVPITDKYVAPVEDDSDPEEEEIVHNYHWIRIDQGLSGDTQSACTLYGTNANLFNKAWFGSGELGVFHDLLNGSKNDHTIDAGRGRIEQGFGIKLLMQASIISEGSSEELADLDLTGWSGHETYTDSDGSWLIAKFWRALRNWVRYDDNDESYNNYDMYIEPSGTPSAGSNLEAAINAGYTSSRRMRLVMEPHANDPGPHFKMKFYEYRCTDSSHDHDDLDLTF